MRILGDRANQIPEREHKETIELGATPLHPQIKKFLDKWGNDYQPIYSEDMLKTKYEEVGK